MAALTSFLPMESVHPLVVHFPIVLLLIAILLNVLALGLKRPWQMLFDMSIIT